MKISSSTNRFPAAGESSVKAPESRRSDSGEGRLIIRDNFGPSGPGEMSHGDRVILSARAQGFQGDITVSQRELSTLREQPGIQLARQANLQLIGAQLTPDQTRAALSESIGGSVSAFLTSEAAALEEQAAERGSNSVYNESAGTSIASESLRLYQLASKAWDPRTSGDARRQSQQLMNNLAGAFELDADKLAHPDPKVSAPERQKLQQGIIDATAQAFRRDDVQSGRERWGRAVDAFEEANSSVVVAAGNEGNYGKTLAGMNHGRPLSVPDNFSTSVLETNNVTSVGGVFNDPREGGKLKLYTNSSTSSGVDLFANALIVPGSELTQGSHGTSMAAPKVAVEYFQGHQRFPGLTSAQMENLILNRLTSTLDTERGTISVLNSPGR